ncbi:MAG TPA: DUF3293 domain-containing protein [Candidatus Limnocylindria bacterium]|jgi:hypothetical protein|nr:DUF3293 domain-containing protein [Candidatus Limnocylindria bacterium]
MPNPAHLTAHFRCEWPVDRIPARFGIVTAWNPEDRLASACENVAADNRLESTLKLHGWAHFRVVGGSPDFTHVEPGWGIQADPGELLVLGRQFNQAAIYWIDGTELWLYSCSGNEQLALGSWYDRTQFEGT